VAVTISVGGYDSNSASLAFSPPALTDIEPQSASTAGGTLLTVKGSNFGPLPQVALGAALSSVANCTVVTVSPGHDEAVCSVPEGQGSLIPLRVLSGGQISNSLTFSYDLPSIAQVLFSPPTGIVTTGGARVTLVGESLGFSGAVSLLSSPTPTPTSFSLPAEVLSHNSTHVVFLAPAGQGRGWTIRLTLTSSGPSAIEATAPTTLDYAFPSILACSPLSAPTEAGSLNMVLSVTGANFGPSSLAGKTGLVSVQVGGAACLPLFFHNHSFLTCALPEGDVGGEVVNITVSTTSPALPPSSPPLVSNAVSFLYQHPSITAVRPTLGPSTGNVVLTLEGSSFGMAPNGFVTVGVGEGRECLLLSETTMGTLA